MTLVRHTAVPPQLLGDSLVPAVVLSNNDVHDVFLDETQIDPALLDPLAEAAIMLAADLEQHVLREGSRGTVTVLRRRGLLIASRVIKPELVAGGYVIAVPEQAITHRLATYLSVLGTASLQRRRLRR